MNVKKIMKEAKEKGMETCDLFKGQSFKIEDVDDKKHTILFVASDETVDRVNERLMADGCQVENYNKTGKPFLWCHNRRVDNLPLGRGIWSKILDREVKILTEFYVDKGNAWSEYCKTVYEMYRDDFMQSVSVGFIPIDRRSANEGELKDFPELSSVITKWELLEHSAVPIPANPNAVQEKILQEKLVEVKEAMADDRIKIPSICLEDFGFKEEEKEKEPEAEKEIKATYDCECIECGHKMASEEHCKDIKCSECGGEMRRVERPGPGKDIDPNMTKITVYDFDGKEIGTALIPETEIIIEDPSPATVIKEKREGKLINIIKPSIRLKDSEEKPENPEENEGLSLSDEQIDNLKESVCSNVKTDLVDSFLRGFRKKLGIVNSEDKP